MIDMADKRGFRHHNLYYISIFVHVLIKSVLHIAKRCDKRSSFYVRYANCSLFRYRPCFDVIYIVCHIHLQCGTMMRFSFHPWRICTTNVALSGITHFLDVFMYSKNVCQFFMNDDLSCETPSSSLQYFLRHIHIFSGLHHYVFLPSLNQAIHNNKHTHCPTFLESF